MENGFESFPFVRHIRELRKITGGSTTCGWMTDEGVFFLYSMVKWYKPDLVIQTGHLWGKSALTIAEALNDGFLNGKIGIETEEQNADKQCEAFMTSNAPQITRGEVISLDPYPINVPRLEKGLDYISALHDNFRFYKIKSHEFFKNIGKYIDGDLSSKRIMGVVDGDHSWLGCASDLEDLKNIGAKMIFVDDTSWLPHIRKVCRIFSRKEGYSFHDYRYNNGFAVLVKQKKPPIHEIDGDYDGIPLGGRMLYRLFGYSFTRAFFNKFIPFYGCSVRANRWTFQDVPKWLFGIKRIVK